MYISRGGSEQLSARKKSLLKRSERTTPALAGFLFYHSLFQKYTELHMQLGQRKAILMSVTYDLIPARISGLSASFNWDFLGI